jgi:hypothetical protein
MAEERLFKLGLALIILFIFVICIILDGEKKEYNTHELKVNGVETEALTYDYRIESVPDGKYRRDKQVVNYTYFSDSREYKFRRILGNTNDRFERFKKPLVFRLIYSKNKPDIHELVLTYSLDSISNQTLKNFAVSYFQLPNLAAFYKMQSNQ